MTDKSTKFGLMWAAIVSVVLIAYILGITGNIAFASAPSGLPATVATSSIASVSSTATTIFATSTCASRIITTVANPIMLTFSDYSGQTPTGSFGHLQAASTTVTYDSGQYGCGAVKAYSFGTASITVTETR